MFRAPGLTAAEQAVYEALLRATATADEPRSALEALFLAREHELVAARQRVATLDRRYEQAAEQQDVATAVEVVHGAPEVKRRFFDVQLAAPSQVRGTEGPPYLITGDGDLDDVDDIDDAESPVIALLRRGMGYRIIYDRRALDLPGRPYGEVLDVSDGRRARIGDVPTKLVLTDEPAGFLPLHDEFERSPAALIVYDPTLLAALSALFELYWERAVPINVRAGPEGTDRDLLPLLAAGLTDREIATKLGWSHRTVRRRVRDLMTRLGAQTRFQAGYRAIRQGWLEGNDLEDSDLEDSEYRDDR